jgi:chromosomal replication initiator protein
MSAGTTFLPPDELPALDQLWRDCLDHLEKSLPSQQYKTWVAPLAFGRWNPDSSPIQIEILAPNRFKQTWAREQLVEPLTNWWQARLQRAVDLQISITPETTPDSSASADLTGSGTRPEASAASRFETDVTTEQPAGQETARLNPEWTFDLFVPGKANQLARAAALQVADNPGSGYNPLFLYGGVGLGKSHLIHSVGNKMLEENPSAKIRYIHAEAYVSDVVRAYQRKSFDELKRYYHSLDLLLIDDIQFFAGKSRTQEEFFYTFEALVAAKKQIIITSDTYPSELDGIDSRLVSRFGSGLTVAIEPPELEMRVAILLRKAEHENLALGEEEAFFIARQLRSNVRELEGALRKVIAYCHFHQKTPSIEVVKDALKDLLSLQKTSISVENIQKTVADFYKIKVADMYSKRRPANIALPRQIAMYLAKELTQKSLPDIGDLFGGRDHTTVLHAVRKISESRQLNAELHRELHLLEQQLRG